MQHDQHALADDAPDDIGARGHRPAATCSCASGGRVNPIRIAVWTAVALIVVADIAFVIFAAGSPSDVALGIIMIDALIAMFVMLVTAILFGIVLGCRWRRKRARQREYVLNGERHDTRADLWRALSPWSPHPSPPLLSEDWGGVVMRDHARERYLIWFAPWTHRGGSLFSIDGGGTDDFGAFCVDGYANRDTAMGQVRLAWTQRYNRIVASRTAFADETSGSYMRTEHRATIDYRAEEPVAKGKWRMGPDQILRPGDVAEGTFALVPLGAKGIGPVSALADLL